jgi:hypothetical protein
MFPRRDARPGQIPCSHCAASRSRRATRGVVQAPGASGRCANI